jgi:hypothetical protein
MAAAAAAVAAAPAIATHARSNGRLAQRIFTTNNVCIDECKCCSSAMRKRIDNVEYCNNGTLLVASNGASFDFADVSLPPPPPRPQASYSQPFMLRAGMSSSQPASIRPDAGIDAGTDVAAATVHCLLQRRRQRQWQQQQNQMLTIWSCRE